MTILHKLFKKSIKLDINIGKTVLHFTTHGCMGTIHEFDYVGIITDVVTEQGYPVTKTYTINILKSSQGEKRDGIKITRKLTNWQIQDIGGVLIGYD